MGIVLFKRKYRGLIQRVCDLPQTTWLKTVHVLALGKNFALVATFKFTYVEMAIRAHVMDSG